MSYILWLGSSRANCGSLVRPDQKVKVDVLFLRMKYHSKIGQIIQEENITGYGINDYTES
jgi:hypothetical protein